MSCVPRRVDAIALLVLMILDVVVVVESGMEGWKLSTEMGPVRQQHSHTPTMERYARDIILTD